MILEVLSTSVMANWKEDVVQGMLTILLTICVIETLNAAFFDRRWLSLSILIIMFWQLWITQDSSSYKLKLLWSVLCVVLLSFSFQPSVGKEKNFYLSISAGTLSSILLFCAVKISRLEGRSKKTLIFIGTGYLSISGLCGFASTLDCLQSFFRVNPCHVVSWTILTTALPCALNTENVLFPRLASLSAALLSIYLLLSITYEGLFLMSLIATMTVWVILEYKSTYRYGNIAEMELVRSGEDGRNRRVLSSRDVFRALMFLFFSVVSFFGTGNIASLNSFDPKSIQTLVSVFNPFLMGSNTDTRV